MSSLNEIMAFKAVWALCTLNKTTQQLKATHYACCLIHGPRPTWGVWTVTGRFQRFFASRASIEEAYRTLTWRMKAASWSLQAVADYSVEHKIQQLEEKYHAPIVRDPVEPAPAQGDTAWARTLPAPPALS